MTTPTPQRVITVSINGTSNAATASYSYLSRSGVPFTNAPVCDLNCNCPTNFLFALDYQSTTNGWTVTNFTSVQPNKQLTATAGPNLQSYCVVDVDTTKSPPKTYAFLLTYTNTVTGAVISPDPQVTNDPS